MSKLVYKTVRDIGRNLLVRENFVKSSLSPLPPLFPNTGTEQIIPLRFVGKIKRVLSLKN